MNRKTFDSAFEKSGHKLLNEQFPVLQDLLAKELAQDDSLTGAELSAVISMEIFKLCDIHMRNVLEELFEVTE